MYCNMAQKRKQVFGGKKSNKCSKKLLLAIDIRIYVRYNPNRTNVLNIYSEAVMRSYIRINKKQLFEKYLFDLKDLYDGARN